MPRNRYATPPLNTGPEPSRIGDYIRWIRDKAEMTRTQFGAAVYAHPAAVEKWENHQRTPSKESVEKIIRNIHVDGYVAEVLAALAAPEFHPITTADWPQITDDDRDYLENSRGPAALHGLPYRDLPAANDEWCRTLPMLKPEPDTARPLNLIERLLLDESTRIIEDRFDRAHVLLFELRIMRPLADPVRFREIVDTCARSPQFDRLWHTDPPQRVIENRSVAIWNAQTVRWDRYRARQNRDHIPPGPFTVYTLYRARTRSAHSHDHLRRLHTCARPSTALEAAR
ncbi:helix-turn-helix transcriptional regulator [Nocardia sp. NPDC050710]|uniref:helix-turn-helix domain-containing protein n=1 Tax=Nocardia sp. NPDC050710 TaxID=3157220 RepID=UPI0033F9211A